MPNPKCQQCTASLNNKWGVDADTGEKYARNQWRCPCPNKSVMKCQGCCECRTSRWGGGAERNVPAPTAPPAPSATHAVAPPSGASAARSRSPRAQMRALVPPLTMADRKIRITDTEMKDRKRAVYRREAGDDRSGWPLPGHSVNEQEHDGCRDTDPYRSIAGGRWRDGLWLDHVSAELGTPLWLAHRQTWSLREEMFLAYAEEQRERLVRTDQVPPDVTLTRKEAEIRRARQRQADASGLSISRHLSSLLMG